MGFARPATGVELKRFGRNPAACLPSIAGLSARPLPDFQHLRAPSFVSPLRTTLVMFCSTGAFQTSTPFASRLRTLRLHRPDAQLGSDPLLLALRSRGQFRGGLAQLVAPAQFACHPGA